MDPIPQTLVTWPMQTEGLTVKSPRSAISLKRVGNILPRKGDISYTSSLAVHGHSTYASEILLIHSRTWLYYQLKGLEGVVTLINAGRPDLTPTGWDIPEGIDHINGFKNTKEIYLKADPDYKNRYTVPILWDQKLQTIGYQFSPSLC